jgi:hypothetical protein
LQQARNFLQIEMLSFQFWKERSNKNLLTIWSAFGFEKKIVNSKKLEKINFVGNL